jgi:CO dehydrogenase/acetyl-CoA synthase delta subunit
MCIGMERWNKIGTTNSWANSREHWVVDYQWDEWNVEIKTYKWKGATYLVDCY